MIFGNPVRGTVHDPSWVRPSGSTEFRETQKFGPTSVTAEGPMNWPGSEGIAAGYYPHFHQGIDLGNGSCGSDVIAAEAGLVRVAGTDGIGAIRVILDHGNGWGTAYWHLHDHAVNVGAKVKKGQLIGHVGDTGHSTACHLHFMVKVGVVWTSSGDNHGYLGSGHLLNPWPRLTQNVTVVVRGPGANIRASAGSGSTPGAVFAHADGDGYIRRAADKVSLGPISMQRRYGGRIAGASYSINGVSGNTWTLIWLDGAWRYLATPLALQSAT